jgi:hypothetical protein
VARVWVGSQWFGRETVQRVAATIEAEPSISRRELSRRVCDWLDWRDPKGKLRDMACRTALLELERRGLVELPAPSCVPSFVARSVGGSSKGVPPKVAKLRCSLEELGLVEVVPVSSRYGKDSATWRALLEHFHYLGAGPLCGAQIRYLIRSAAHGVLGGLSFSGATKRLKNRDEWIGWSETARRANLRFVVCNSRFLIAPGVEVANLASHVLGLAAKRLGEDWQQRYGYEPVLLETFVDGQRFSGTCYRAANWRCLGQTAGRSSGFSNGKKPTGSKEVFVYRLRPDALEVLREAPAQPLVLRGLGDDGENWIEQEFGGVQVFDGRLRTRLFAVVQDFFAQPGRLVPQACGGSMAKVKGTYRLLGNERVEMEALLHGHVEATVQRAREHAVVLVPQDTTFLNYTAHPETEGLGPINTRGDASIGLVVHDTMAFTPDGTPLGLLDVQCWARDPAEAGKREKRKDLPIEEKESIKWLESYRAVAEAQRLCPQTMFVCMGDRESDIHELFQEAYETKAGPKLLVRADRGRNRRVNPTEAGEPHQYLWDRMSSQPVAGELEVVVPRRGSQPKRTARLEVRYAAVTLKSPTRKRLDSIPVWAVYAREVGAPATVKEPLEWLLLTTVEVTSFEHATERLTWYTRRWGIEVYHRILKSGCRIEDRQLSTADRIENCLAIDMVVAWRIHWLTKLGRETPDLPCDVIFEEDEWKAVCAVVRNAPPPSTPPPLRDAIRMIAALGGFLGRKGDGEPGTTTIWRGLERLDGIVIGFRAAMRLYQQRDGP